MSFFSPQFTLQESPDTDEKRVRVSEFLPFPPILYSVWGSSLLFFRCKFMSYSLGPHGLQHCRLPCPSLSPRVCSDSCPLSQWCYLTSSSSVTPFTICLQSFPASGSFSMSQLFSCNFQMLRYKNAGSFLTSHLSPSFISQIHQRIYKLHLQKMSIIWPLLPTFMTCFGSSHCHLLTILLK